MLVSNATQLDRLSFDNDLRGQIAPFGIQNIAEVGLKHRDVFPGDWYGLNSMACIFEHLNQKHSPVSNLVIKTFQMGNISVNEIRNAADNWKNQLLVLVTTRLGMTNIETVYHAPIL